MNTCFWTNLQRASLDHISRTCPQRVSRALARPAISDMPKTLQKEPPRTTADSSSLERCPAAICMSTMILGSAFLHHLHTIILLLFLIKDCEAFTTTQRYPRACIVYRDHSL